MPRADSRPHVERLIRQIGLTAGMFDRDRDVLQLYVDGGTVSLLALDELVELVETLGRHFHFDPAPSREFSIGLPRRRLRQEGLAIQAALGFNCARLCVYGGEEPPQELEACSSLQEALREVDDCREAGLRSIHVDLFHGPTLRRRDFARALDCLIASRPDRIAVCGQERTRHSVKVLPRARCDDPRTLQRRVTLLGLAVEKLCAAGYRHVGMEQVALPEDSLARALVSRDLSWGLLGYTSHGDCDVVGLGAGALSRVGDSLSQNLDELSDWERALDEGRLPIWRGMVLDDDDRVRAEAIRQLMSQGEIDVAGLERRHAIVFPAYFADALERLRPLAADGLVTLEGRWVAATRRGRLLMSIIAMCFDRYLTPAASPPSVAAHVSGGVA